METDGNEPRMYSFGQVETALARVFEVDQKYRSRFTARLKHLRKIGGIIETLPGKGHAISYERDQVLRLLFALEMTECGCEPAVITEFITEHWAQLAEIFEAAANSPTTLLVWPGLMTGGWWGGPFVLMGWYNGATETYTIGLGRNAKCRPIPATEMWSYLDDFTRKFGRAITINIRGRVEQLDKALKTVRTKKRVA
jgi:hypothetical protein